jgi:polar amino acid transport system permease protein
MNTGIADVFLNMDVISRYLPVIGQSLLTTIALAVLIIVGGCAIGTLLAVVRTICIRPVSMLIVAYVDWLRTLPPLVFLILVFFGLPYLNISISPFIATWLTLTVILSAFIEESIWSGIQSIPKGQYEVARSSGLSWSKTMLLVILPQAYRIMLAPLTSRIVSITKDTALGSIIGLTEILGVAQSAASNSGNPSPLTITVALYLLLFLPIVVGSRYLERVWKWKR